MAKNNNSKISVATLDKLIKQIDTEPSMVSLHAGDVSIDIEVRRNVSLQEFCDMVSEAADTYFQYDEEGQEHYVAGMGDFACDYVLIKHLTNLKTVADVASQDEEAKVRQHDRLYALCVHTDLMQLVGNVLPKKLVPDFHEAVYEQVEFRKQQMLSNERRMLQAAADQIDKANTSFAKFVEMFSDVDPASMMETMQNIMSMDVNKLASAVVDAQYDAAAKRTPETSK